MIKRESVKERQKKEKEKRWRKNETIKRVDERTKEWTIREMKRV